MLEVSDIRHPLVARAVFGQPWAVTPEMLQTICSIVKGHMIGRPPDTEFQMGIGGVDFQAIVKQAASAPKGSVAVLPLFGVMSQRMGMMSNMSGGTSTDQFAGAFQALARDPGISAIVIDVDSPGGAVAGTQELWDTIMEARGTKPIVAVANSLMASAAYWVASASDEIVVAPGAEMGSIGIIAAHEDQSGHFEKEGVVTTLVTAGKKKAELNPFGPLTEDAQVDMQAKVDHYYEMMTSAIAKGRGVAQSEVKRGFAEGGTVLAEEAVRLGMADRIETLPQAVARVAEQPPPTRGSKALSGSRDQALQSAEDYAQQLARRAALYA